MKIRGVWWKYISLKTAENTRFLVKMAVCSTSGLNWAISDLINGFYVKFHLRCASLVHYINLGMEVLRVQTLTWHFGNPCRVVPQSLKICELWRFVTRNSAHFGEIAGAMALAHLWHTHTENTIVWTSVVVLLSGVESHLIWYSKNDHFSDGNDPVPQSGDTTGVNKCGSG